MGNSNRRSLFNGSLVSSLLLIVSACAHTPETPQPTKEALSLPIQQAVKETPKPVLAPEKWQVHSTEEKTRSDALAAPKRQNQSNSKSLRIPPAKIPRTLPPKTTTTSVEPTLVFDIPVAYNPRVKYWVEYFQTTGRVWFVKWLERSPRYLPSLQKTLSRHGLPKDLAYIAMIESGFSSQASSTAKAVGPWQFIRETGERYGLKVTWWLDERKDFQKSSDAAAKYLKKLYGMFHNWYLVAASYNTGENRIKRQIEKHGIKNFWMMASLESETKDYVPKLIAALLISKSPGMYGFHNVAYNAPLEFEHFRVPGGTRLNELALAIGSTPKILGDLNPELTHAYIPNFVSGHTIRIPKGSTQLVSLYFRRTIVSER